MDTASVGMRERNNESKIEAVGDIVDRNEALSDEDVTDVTEFANDEEDKMVSLSEFVEEIAAGLDRMMELPKF